MKNFLKLVFFGFFSLVIGGVFSAFSGLDPAYTVSGVAILGFAGSMFAPQGLFALAGPDLTALTTDFLNFGGKIFRKNVNQWALDPAILLYRSVKKPEALPKLSASGNPRPYTAADSVGNGAGFSDRVLTVYNAKWDYDVDPENYRNTYLATQEQNPYYQFILNQVAQEFLSQVKLGTLYLGDRNAAGTTAAAICDGWGTTITDLITATDLTPVTGAAITTVNAVDQVELIADAAPSWMKERDAVMFCSWGTFEKYRTNYRASFGFSFDKRENGSYMIDGKNMRLQPVDWMGTSQRLILTIPGNLVVGTDLESVALAASMRRNIIEVRQMMALGTQIADLEALVVNDQA